MLEHIPALARAGIVLDQGEHPQIRGDDRVHPGGLGHPEPVREAGEPALMGQIQKGACNGSG